MIISRLFFTLAIVSLSTFMIAQEETQPRWAVIGSKTINFKADKAEIPIKLKDTPITTIRLGFNGGVIKVHHSKVHFKNGEVQTIPMNKNFRSGMMTRIIDLHGAKREISKLILYYTPNHVAKDQVTVELWAKIELEKNLANN